MRNFLLGLSLSLLLVGGSAYAIAPLIIEDGGTGASTAQGARTNILPSQSGNIGKALVTDGTDVSWSTVSGDGGSVTSTFGNTKQLAWVANGSSYSTWTNMPTSSANFLMTSTTPESGYQYYKRIDLTNAYRFRTIRNISVSGFAGSYIWLQYSYDRVNWYDAGSSEGNCTLVGTGNIPCPWATLVTGARTDVYLRYRGYGGNDVIDPRFYNLTTEFTTYASTEEENATTTDIIQFVVSPTANQAWSNMPLARSGTYYNGFGSAYHYKTANLYRANKYRIVSTIATTTNVNYDPISTMRIDVQYSYNKTNWFNLNSGVASPATSTGELDISQNVNQVNVGNWVDVAEGSKGAVWLRFVGYGGNGVKDMLFRNLELQIDSDLNADVTTSGSSGNPFNQWLDTTNTPTFFGLQLVSTGTSDGLLENASIIFTNSDDPYSQYGIMTYGPNDNSFSFATIGEDILTSTTFNFYGDLVVSDGLSVTNTSTLDSVVVGGDITPETGDTYNLGSNDNKWNNIFTNNIYVSATSTLNNVNADNIIPNNNDTYNLGSSSYKWNNIYANSLYASSTSYFEDLIVYDDVNISGDITTGNGFDFNSTLNSVGTTAELPTKARNLYIADGYAYVATYGTSSWDSFRIVDISDPNNPRSVGGENITNLPHSDAKRVFAVGNYAYILYNGVGITEPFRIIDISDKSNPVVVGGANLTFADFGTSPGQPFYISGNYAYLMGANDLYIVDVSNPYNPSLVSTLADIVDTPWDIKVVGDYAYICNREDPSATSIKPLTIINVRDKGNPSLTSELTIPDADINYDCWSVDVNGGYAYLGLGVIGGGTHSTGTLAIVDISDPETPTLKGGMDLEGTADYSALNFVRVLGERLYSTTWGADNVFLTIDISSSTNPSILKEVNVQENATTSGALTFDFSGNHLVMGFAPVFTAPVPDVYTTSTGYFRIYEIPGLDVMGLHADSISTGLLQVFNNAVFNQRVSIWDGLEVGSGGIFTQGALSVMSTTTPSYIGLLGVGTSSPISGYDFVVNNDAYIGDSLTILGSANISGTTTSTNFNLMTNGSLNINNVKLAYGYPTYHSYFFGESGTSTQTGNYNNGVGYMSLWSLTDGVQNNAYGYKALTSITTGDRNNAYGYGSMRNATSGNDNTSMGDSSMVSLGAGSWNSAYGRSSAYYNVNGNYNTAMGARALLNSTGSSNVGLGYYAGAYELGDNAFYVNNQNRTNTAGDKSLSLLYGGFAATAANQFLTVNGAFSVTGTTTLNSDLNILGSATGTKLNLTDSIDWLSLISGNYYLNFKWQTSTIDFPLISGLASSSAVFGSDIKAVGIDQRLGIFDVAESYFALSALDFSETFNLMFDVVNAVINFSGAKIYDWYNYANDTYFVRFDAENMWSYFGTSTSYSMFETDGTLVANGNATVWEDAQGSFISFGTGDSAPGIVQASTSDVYLRCFDGLSTSEQVFGCIEVPHDYKEGSSLYPHIHWLPVNGDSGVVKWQGSFWITNNGDPIPAQMTISATSSASGAWVSTFADFGAVSGSGVEIGNQVCFRLFRNPGDGDDTYESDACGMTFGIHYESDTLGSREIRTK
jgi:hypothetical protein